MPHHHFLACFRSHPNRPPPRHRRPSPPKPSVSQDLFQHYRIFSLHDLKLATDDFHPRNKLGEGGFGWVYKGVLMDGTEIAVKQLIVETEHGKEQFLNEVTLLSTVQHRNLVRLLGCCVEGSSKILVYEYLRNRSLDNLLFNSGKYHRKCLEWSVRHAIIMGAAKGLSYLHEDSRVRIIHRDIKASNILLDDKFCPKISDFGLARLLASEQTHASTKVAGTFGYLAPEYAVSGKLTEKADVYSFGVVMLEIVSGRKNTDFQLPPKRQRLLQLTWRLYTKQRILELADPVMGNRFVPEEFVRTVHVALLCTQASADSRPSMSKVVTLLAGHSEIAEKPTKPPLIASESSSKPRYKNSSETSSSAGPSSREKTSSSIFSNSHVT